MFNVIDNMKKYKLDFDDAYQFSVAQKYDLTIVTFDKDFNYLGQGSNYQRMGGSLAIFARRR